DGRAAARPACVPLRPYASPARADDRAAVPCRDCNAWRLPTSASRHRTEAPGLHSRPCVVPRTSRCFSACPHTGRSDRAPHSPGRAAAPRLRPLPRAAFRRGATKMPDGRASHVVRRACRAFSWYSSVSAFLLHRWHSARCLAECSNEALRLRPGRVVTLPIDEERRCAVHPAAHAIPEVVAHATCVQLCAQLVAEALGIQLQLVRLADEILL